MRIFWLVLVMAALAVFASPHIALAVDAAVGDGGVNGCNSVKVDPNMTLEAQQDICGNAEHFISSSCALGGHGTCSSPKTNDVLVDGDHCVCLEDLASASTEEPPAS